MQLRFQDFARVNNAEAASCAGAKLISKMCNASKNLMHHPKGHAGKKGGMDVATGKPQHAAARAAHAALFLVCSNLCF